MKQLICRLLCILSISLLAGCGGSGSSSSLPTHTLIYARGSDADRLDPVNTDNGESVKVIVNIFDTLVQYHDETTELVPGLAERWETSQDGRTWTFHLRKDVKFHDGTPFDADAVIFSFERMILDDHPHLAMKARPYRPNYLMIQSMKADGPHTVVFTLNEPSPVFINNLAMFPASIVSPTAVKKLGGKFTANPVGTGPFRFKSWEVDQQLVLEANKDYWNGAPKINRVVFVPVPDDATRVQQLKRGEVHIVDNLPPVEVESLVGAANITSQTQPGMNVAYLAMQTEKSPLNNELVRQAIGLAIDKNQLVEAFYMHSAKPAVNMVPLGMWGHHDRLYQENARWQCDPGYAIELLERAAKEDGFELPLKLELSVMASPRPYMQQPLETAAYIKDQLKLVKIDLTIRRTPNPKHFERLMSGDYELGLIGWSSDNNDPDNFLYTLLDQDNISEMGNNISRYRNDELHDLLIRAQHEMDADKREQLYFDAQELIFRKAPVIPLVHASVRIVQRTELKGYKLHPTSIVRVRHAFIEADK